MQTRRDALKHGLAAAGALGTAGLVPAPAHASSKAAFGARSVQDAVKALGATSFAESRDVTIEGPEIAENGAVVPVTMAARLANVRKLALLVEKNPNPLVAVFNLGPAIEANFSLRTKVGESSDVYAVAITADGKAYLARRDIKVTIGGCG